PGAAPMAKLYVLTWLGNAFAVLLGKHGDVTQPAHEAGCSRQAVYTHAQRVQHAVEQAQLPGPRRDQLLQENRRLKEQVAALQRQLGQAVVLDRAKQERLAVTTSAMGLSLNQIRDVFAILVGQAKGKLPGRATVGRWV